MSRDSKGLSDLECIFIFSCDLGENTTLRLQGLQWEPTTEPESFYVFMYSLTLSPLITSLITIMLAPNTAEWTVGSSACWWIRLKWHDWNPEDIKSPHSGHDWGPLDSMRVRISYALLKNRHALLRSIQVVLCYRSFFFSPSCAF